MSTEVQVVPLKKVLLRIESGWSPVCEPYEPGGSEWGVLGLGAVTSGAFLESDAKRLPASLLPRPALEVRPRDVLVARANGSKRLVGVGVVVPKNVRQGLMFPDLVYRLVPDAEVLDADYLGILVSAPAFRRQVESAMRSTSGQFKISKADLREFSIPVPPLSEQRRIVEVLGAVAEQERVVEAAIAKLNLMCSGAIEKYLARRDWDGELKEALSGDPRNGYSPTGVAEWTGVQMLGLGCLTPNGFAARQLKNAPKSVSRKHFAMLKTGDLLMGRANTRELVGLAGLFRDVGSPCIYPDLMMRLPVSEEWLPRALEIVLRSVRARRQIQARAQGTSESMVKISGRAVKSLRIPRLNSDEQAQVVRIAEHFEERLSSEREALANLGLSKAGLIDDLLSGRKALSDAA